MAAQQTRLQRLLVWRVWERLLEIEFLDRSVALAGKAFVSFFPLVIVVAAFMPERIRSSIITSLTFRLGVRGDALALTREAFASSDDIKTATGVLGLVLTIFFAGSFTTALQRVYLRVWRRPPSGGAGLYWRGVPCLLAVLACMALLGGMSGLLDGILGVGVLAILALVLTSGMWWWIAWFLLLGAVRARALLLTGLITGVSTAVFALSAAVWMPEMVKSNEAQFGFYGVALSLITWFSGAAICVVAAACAGAVFAEDAGLVGTLARGHDPRTLTAGAAPSLLPPVRELDLRDAFHSSEDP